ncbi:DUF1173 family protein [Caballeronia sp. ATUFL_M1_KS5A]|uniref:DUF1173 family protein n=1 Tax=Caballeronia sp. ATUFL_M1_KS5A TaxID=2921778 RepID=UPI0020285648|nr:DUF1173 family protein [Caballeronia sp. ATUFL_M1_KS5A]
MVHVSFDSLTVPLEDVQNSPARYARQLERAKKSPGYAVCRCNAAGGGEPLRLVVRRYGALFHLARWPDEGPHHNSKCPFYATAAATGNGKADAADAIQHTPTGLNVKLDATLFVKTVETSPRLSATNSGAGRTRRAAPLLGFLQRLWIEAELHTWTGASARSWGQCNAHLVAALGDGNVNGKPMQSVLHVMRRYDENEAQSIVAEFDDFLGRIATTPTASQRGLVLGELRTVDASRYGFVVKLRQTKRTFFASKQLIEMAAASFRSAWAMVGDASARIVLLAVIERTKEGNLRIVDIALQLCNSSFIPCDSSYEVAMANRLVAERRRFTKPLRLEPGDELLPDFQLSDTEALTAIEVYGMHGNPQYLERKKEKQAHYARTATPCVEWIPPAELASVRLPAAA